MKSCKTLLALGATFLLAACGPTGPSHQHVYSEDWTYDENQHWHVCTVDGCKQTSEKINHSLEEVEDDDYLKTAATCEEPGVYYKSCECGYYDPDQTFTTPALGHSYGAYFVDHAPTKTSYSAYDTFEVAGLIVKAACQRQGCDHEVEISNSNFDAIYNSGQTFLAGDTQVTLKDRTNNKTVVVTGLTVGKAANAIVGLADATIHCHETPDFSGVTARNGTPVISYEKDGEPFEGDFEAGTYTVVATVAESAQYSAVRATATVTVTHQYDQEVEDDRYLAGPATCTEPATYFKSCVCGEFDAEGETFKGSTPLGHNHSILEVVTAPKSAYNALETFDITGMVANLKCSHSPCTDAVPVDVAQVTVTYQNGECIHGGDTKVILNYQEKTFDFAITVTKLANEITGLSDSAIHCLETVDVTNVKATNGTPTFVYKDGDGEVVDGAALVAGTYSLTASVAESTDYQAASKTVAVTVTHLMGEDGKCACGEVLEIRKSMSGIHNPVVGAKDTNLVIDLTQYGIKADEITGTLETVFVNGSEVNGATLSGSTLTVPVASLPSGMVFGEQSLRIELSQTGPKIVISGAFTYCTAVLNSLSDVKRYCATVFDFDDGSKFKSNFGEGEYYALNTNLDGTQTWVYPKTGASVGAFHSSCSGASWDGKYGFHGTFDGNGYTLHGGTTVGSTFGLFGGLGKDAVVKDFNITGVSYSPNANQSVLAYLIGGCLLDNVFIEVLSSATATTVANDVGVLVSNWSNDVSLNRVTVAIRNSDNTGIGYCGSVIKGISNASGSIKARTCTASLFSGYQEYINISGLTYMNWDFASPSNFNYKEQEGLYRFAQDSRDYHKIVVDGYEVPFTAWKNANGNTIVDVDEQYMNANSKVYVIYSSNGGAFLVGVNS